MPSCTRALLDSGTRANKAFGGIHSIPDFPHSEHTGRIITENGSGSYRKKDSPAIPTAWHTPQTTTRVMLLVQVKCALRVPLALLTGGPRICQGD